MTTLLLVLAGVLLVALVATFLLRRHFLLSGLGAVTMWLRPVGSPRWSVGVAWYSGEQLLWYRALSLSVRPNQRLCRTEFHVEGRRRPTPEDGAVPQDSQVLICRTGAGPQELAMDTSTVTGFLSWIESAPPLGR
ncbi:hypothetical protein ASG36_15385 [Geodermatophilus sp. Leaf369]|uniref:DUF2550 domain-containing protein n=1 Tax=Geodermatophilus sp. Leaf369 TaxID=1736354 RepID=UPI0006F960C3|nr:DUF2550 domain-containing protein [Geodermatophilus sp. Leaf369]KQS57945.1 hypothetical protein ASG36_15385 [Geodermatophilus sp. Leaf369]QNG35866.1 DUF2550 family protein [Geodermatophilaceae bacterium NBWT11]